MLNKTIDAITAHMATPGSVGTVADAQARAFGTAQPNQLGELIDEFEINDYPQIARQRITGREPLLDIDRKLEQNSWSEDNTSQRMLRCQMVIVVYLWRSQVQPRWPCRRQRTRSAR